MLNKATSDDSTNYTIYLVNQELHKKTFWCFLQKPEDKLDATVYANSSAQLTVDPNYDGENFFTIPLQYSLGVEASNKAVGLSTEINSQISEPVKTGETWQATYNKAYEDPELTPTDKPNEFDDSIVLLSNNFKQGENEQNHWFGSAQFGIQTEMGFMGFTWSPDPGETYIIQPKFAFYIALGSFSSNKLADMDDVSLEAQEITLDDFDDNKEVTVTRTPTGDWIKTPGKA